MTELSFIPSASTPSQALMLVREFLAEQSESLLSTAMFLGEALAHRRCLRLLSAVRDTVSLTRHLRTELVALHRLLTGDPDPSGFGIEVVLDPEDPRIHDVCRLADGLFDLLCAIVDLEDGAPEVSAYIGVLAA